MRIKVIPKLNLVRCVMFLCKIKLNLNQGINFFRNEHCYYCSNIKTYFTTFTVCFWFEVLSFLLVFDIINFFISSKRLKGLILNSSSHYKHVFESMNHVCDEKVQIFLETNIVTTVQTPKHTLTDLPYAFWFEVLTFLSVFGIVNLFISSKRFKGLILNNSSNYKDVFESMNHICDEQVWDRVLSFSFSNFFLNRVKNNLEDDLEIFLYVKFRFYSFVFPIFLYIQFFHIFVFAKNL